MDRSEVSPGTMPRLVAAIRGRDCHVALPGWALGGPTSLVWSHYANADGVLVPGPDAQPLPNRTMQAPFAGPLLRWWNPSADPRTLLAEFAKLHEGDGDAVTAFASRWGLVGNPDLWRALRDSARDEAGPRPWEPLHWIWSHARTVRTTLRVLYLYRRKDQRLRSLLRQQFVGEVPLTVSGRSTAVQGLVVTTAQRAGQATAFWADLLSEDAGLDEFVGQYLTQAINPNLVGAYRELVQFDAAFELVPAFDSLLAFTYWQLADLVRDRKQALAECAYCNEIFVQYDRRQRFCPPPSDTASTASLCGMRARDARRRARHKNRRPMRRTSVLDGKER